MADSDDKTEAATPRRLSRARDDGNVAVSRELPALVTLAVLWLMLVMAAPAMTRALYAWLASFFAGVGRIDMSDGGVAAMHMAMLASAHALLPVGLVALCAGSGTTLLQTGFLFTLSKLMPDLARLNPGKGFKRLFSVHSVVDALKATAKVTVVAVACWQVLSSDLPQLEQAVYWDAATMLDRMTRLVLHVLLTMLMAQAVVAAADLFWVRYRHARDLRMSRFDIRQESKDTEGDPVIRRRMRQIRMLRARRRMRTAVRRATVVVANPTHYAVALRYDRERNAAPVVVAKGVDSMAVRIRETAAEFDIPVVVNPPLARALHAVEIDADIPPELYKAVAELIAYVWRLSRRHARGPVRPPVGPPVRPPLRPEMPA